MDFVPDGGFSGVGMLPEMEMGYDNWGNPPNDHSIWATEDEYRTRNSIDPFSNSDSINLNPLNEHPNKKSRTSQSSDSASNRSKAIGKMFYKTKLCCKFRAGVCPYVTNCNFAHGMEELRKPPPNWQEIVAAHEEERGVTVEQREEHQIPTISTSDSRNEQQRSYKGRHCKKFYTEEGCPYGESCTFLHDEQSRARESVAISVSPTVGGGFGGVGVATQKPSNWKTRICNKWETTGNCPFGNKCHFAHGLAELHKFGDGYVEGETTPTETKQSGMGGTKSAQDMQSSATAATTLSVPRTDFHHHVVGAGIPSQSQSQRACSVSQTQVIGQRAVHKWKGPDKISRIYGDWIDDIA